MNSRVFRIRPVLALGALLLPAFPACSTEPRELTLEETQLLRQLEFGDPAVIAAIASVGGPVERLFGLADDGFAAPAAGVTVEIHQDRVETALGRLRQELSPLGFGVYHAEQHFGFQPDRLAVVKGTDPYEFLSLVRVDGINHGLEHEAVLARLRAWDQRFGLDYRGAGLDWVRATFKTTPPDLDAFAREVYAFCPDVVDQGTETVEALAAEMRRSGTLYCWWD